VGLCARNTPAADLATMPVETRLMFASWLTCLQEVLCSRAQQHHRRVCRRCRFMSVNTAVQQLLEIEADCQGGAYDEDTMCVGLARVGADDQKVKNESRTFLSDGEQYLHLKMSGMITCGWSCSTNVSSGIGWFWAASGVHDTP